MASTGGEVWVGHVDDVELQELSWLTGRWARVIESKRGLVFLAGRLGPGESAGWHDHPEDEVFIVLSGHGVARWRMEGTEYQHELRPGSAFFKIGGIPHNMDAIGDEPLVGVGCKV